MRREQVHMLVDVLADLGERWVGSHQAPPEAQAHFRAAKREALLGVRALVDHALAQQGTAGAGGAAQAGPAGGGPTSIPVEEE